jgi:surface carbohydrate biosynthesis protein
MKNIDFIIFYEHVARELESDKLLYNYLCHLGYTGVVLPIHFNRYVNLLRYQPKLIIMPFLYNQTKEADLYKELYPDVQILNLHSEQISSKLSEGHMLPRHEKTRNCYHISWGEDFAKQLHKSGVSSQNIFVTGSIRNDLISVYKNSLSEKIILIPTSFSLSFITEEEKQDYINNKTFIDEKHTEEIINFTKNTRDAFFKIIYEFSTSISNEYTIILRPHPHVGISEYIKCFLEINSLKELPDNIKVIREGAVQSAIAKCECVISQGSTTALEAAMMSKRTFLLMPYKLPDEMYCEFMDYFPKATNFSELLELFKETEINPALKNYLFRTYFKLDGKSFIRVSKVVQKILEEKLPNRINRKKILKPLLKILFVDLPKNILLHFGLLGKIFSFYRGITEDCISVLSPDSQVNINNMNDYNIYDKGDYCIVDE